MKTKLLLFLFIFLPTFLFALPHDLHFRHFSVENGLSSNCVRTLLQDKYGFIWAGTDEGLSRYDGVEFKSYKYSGKSPRGLNQNYILSLYEADNLLWVGTDDGAYCYNYGLDSFEPLLINGEQVINCAVTCITQDKDGCIWIATAGSGVYKYNKEKSIFQQYEVTACMGIVYTVLVDRENRVWAVSTQGQSHIFRLNKTDDRFEPFVLKYDKEDKPSSRSLVIFEDSSMNLWLGTWEDGLQRIEIGRAHV